MVLAAYQWEVFRNDRYGKPQQSAKKYRLGSPDKVFRNDTSVDVVPDLSNNRNEVASLARGNDTVLEVRETINQVRQHLFLSIIFYPSLTESYSYITMQ
jgi:hypothetical protein